MIKPEYRKKRKAGTFLDGSEGAGCVLTRQEMVDNIRKKAHTKMKKMQEVQERKAIAALKKAQGTAKRQAQQVQKQERICRFEMNLHDKKRHWTAKTQAQKKKDAEQEVYTGRHVFLV